MNKSELLHRLTMKQNFIKKYYGELAEQWKNETDDRGLFSIMYFDLLQGLEELKQLNGCSQYLYFEMILPKYDKDRKQLLEIRDYFLSK